MTNSDNGVTNFLGSLLGSATEIGKNYLASKNAPRPQPAAPKETPVNWTRIATIGGAIVGVLALLLIVLRRK